MFYVERLDVASGQPFLWEPIESSWEFTNPTAKLPYACEVAKILALSGLMETHSERVIQS